MNYLKGEEMVSSNRKRGKLSILPKQEPKYIEATLSNKRVVEGETRLTYKHNNLELTTIQFSKLVELEKQKYPTQIENELKRFQRETIIILKETLDYGINVYIDSEQPDIKTINDQLTLHYKFQLNEDEIYRYMFRNGPTDEAIKSCTEYALNKLKNG